MEGIVDSNRSPGEGILDSFRNPGEDILGIQKTCGRYSINIRPVEGILAIEDLEDISFIENMRKAF